jgi:hypothetical protein
MGLASAGAPKSQRSIDGCRDWDEHGAERVELPIRPARLDIRDDLLPESLRVSARRRQLHHHFAIACPGCSLDVGRIADVAPSAHPVKRRVDGCRRTRVRGDLCHPHAFGRHEPQEVHVHRGRGQPRARAAGSSVFVLVVGLDRERDEHL